MADPLTLDEDGYIQVVMKSPAGEIAKDLDLYETHNTLVDLSTKNKEARVFHQSVREFLQSKGFPACSDRLADKFALAVFDRVNALKNADGGDAKPASPDFTESTPSNSPALSA